MRITYTIILVILFLPISVMGFSLPIEAKPVNVAECLEEKNLEECEELSDVTDEQKKDESDSSSVLMDDEQGSSGSLFFSIVKLVIALLFILVLIYGTLHILKRRNRMFGQAKVLENLGGIPVGQNKSIQMIRVGSKVYMVGVGDNVELLQEVTDQELIAEMISEREEQSQGSYFPMQSIFTKQKEQVSGQQTNSFTELFKRELDELKQNRNKMKQIKQKEDHIE